MAAESSKVLFCTVGATPQVVTETVWCLLRQNWRPDRIDVVTTAFKLDFIRKSLQTANGPLGRLMNCPPSVTVHVPRRGGEDHYAVEAGQDYSVPPDVLRDVNDQDEAARMGNLILCVIAGITNDPNTKLHVSLAGGCKTMSAHALIALSLVGRAVDRASHVLVDPKYEDHPDFWYPDQGGRLNTKEELWRHRQEGKPLSEPTLDPAAAKDKIILVPTPAPLMRNRVVKGEVLSRLDLLDLMQKANLATALEQDPCVTLHVHENSISTHGVKIELSPKHFAVYRLLATARQEKWSGSGPEGVGTGHSGWLTYTHIADADTRHSGTAIRDLMTQFVRDAELYAGRFADADNSNTSNWSNAIRPNDDRQRVENIQGNLAQDITNLPKVIANEVELDAAAVLAPQRNSSKRGQARFGLKVPSEKIEIV
jgi:CRISPR-associated protein (TIGR02584 family)